MASLEKNIQTYKLILRIEDRFDVSSIVFAFFF